MDTNVECLCRREVESLEYFKLSGMRHDDANAVNQRVYVYLWNDLFLAKL